MSDLLSFSFQKLPVTRLHFPSPSIKGNSAHKIWLNEEPFSSYKKTNSWDVETFTHSSSTWVSWQLCYSSLSGNLWDDELSLFKLYILGLFLSALIYPEIVLSIIIPSNLCTNGLMNMDIGSRTTSPIGLITCSVRNSLLVSISAR